MSFFKAQKADEHSTHNKRLGDPIGGFKKHSGTQEAPISIPDDDEYDISSESGTEAGSPTPSSPLSSSQMFIRNGPIPVQERMERLVLNGADIMPDDMLEILAPKGKFQCTFLKVTVIYNSSGRVIIRGTPFTRARHTMGMIKASLNELVEVLDIDEDDERPYYHQAAIEISPAEMVCKRKYQITNTSWSAFACRVRDFSGSAQNAEEMGMLTVRWKMITRYQTANKRAQLKPVGRCLIQFREDEVPHPLLRISDEIKLNNWRGTKIRGGAHNPDDQSHGSIDAERQNKAEYRAIPLKKGQKYTFADMFCGCGGASRGAKAAGFRVTLACDSDHFACRSFQDNFPECDLREVDVHNLLVLLETSQIRVDILHISPPCQVWSPVHTRPGQNDDANSAIMYAVFEMVKKLRPRIITVEQTFGILQSRFADYFHLLLNCFTSLGYSVSWRSVRLDTWGVPQPRKRVILVASCPGEVHPAIPGASGILVSVQRSLSTIDRDATLHNPHELLNQPGFPKPRYDGDVSLSRTILCSNPGEDFYHPNGARPFTLRELASLQTFPSNHKFVGSATRIKKQIGNAFPSRAVEYLYQHLRSHLLAVDGVYEKGGDENKDEDELIIM